MLLEILNSKKYFYRDHGKFPWLMQLRDESCLKTLLAEMNLRQRDMLDAPAQGKQIMGMKVQYNPFMKESFKLKAGGSVSIWAE